MEHFPGQTASPVLPSEIWAGPRDRTWAALTDALGISQSPEVGEHITISAPDAPRLAGTVADAAPHRMALLLDEPARGTAFIAAEGIGEEVSVSIWSYLYGADGAAAAERDDPIWRQWLSDRGLRSASKPDPA